MARRGVSSESAAPRRAPAPEGPQEIAERVRRSREGLPTAARRRLARLFGLEKLSPVRQVLTLFAAAVEISLLALGVFTDLPVSWLLTTAFLILPLLHYFEGRTREALAERRRRDARGTWRERRAGYPAAWIAVAAPDPCVVFWRAEMGVGYDTTEAKIRR